MEHQDDVGTDAAFAVALSRLYEEAGRPKYEWLKEKTGVPTSSLDDWLKGRSVPSTKSRRQLHDVVTQLHQRAAMLGHPRQHSWEWWEALRHQAESARRTARSRRSPEPQAGPASPPAAQPATQPAPPPERTGRAAWRRRVPLVVACALALTVAVVVSMMRGTGGSPQGPGSQADASDASTARSGDPVSVAALRLETTDPEWGWVTPDVLELGESEMRGVGAGDSDWFRQHGAVDTNDLELQLVLAGARDDSVRILDIKPIMDCSAPLSGTLFYSPPAGADASVRIGFDLDEPDPVARIVEGNEWYGDYFGENTVSLEPDEQQTFQITARTSEQYCEYTLELTVLDGGAVVTQEISNGGEPFRVTAMETGEFGEAGYASHYDAIYVGALAGGGCQPVVSWVRADPGVWTGDGQPC